MEPQDWLCVIVGLSALGSRAARGLVKVMPAFILLCWLAGMLTAWRGFLEGSTPERWLGAMLSGAGILVGARLCADYARHCRRLKAGGTGDATAGHRTGRIRS